MWMSRWSTNPKNRRKEIQLISYKKRNKYKTYDGSPVKAHEIDKKEYDIGLTTTPRN